MRMHTFVGALTASLALTGLVAAGPAAAQAADAPTQSMPAQDAPAQDTPAQAVAPSPAPTAADSVGQGGIQGPRVRINAPVKSAEGREVGHVLQYGLDEKGNPTGLIIKRTSRLGMGRLVQVPLEQVSVAEDGTVTVSMSREEIAELPRVTLEE